MEVQAYFSTALKNEDIFKKILRDLKDNFQNRPRGAIIPKNLNLSLPVSQIIEKYSTGERSGKFTITNFQKTHDKKFTISFQNIDYSRRGGTGAELRYAINHRQIEYEQELMNWEFKI